MNVVDVDGRPAAQQPTDRVVSESTIYRPASGKPRLASAPRGGGMNGHLHLRKGSRKMSG
jgi:hypothetical protein